MIPIQSICSDCSALLARSLENLEGECAPISLHAHCKHHAVALSLEVLPGGVIGHWMLTPAASAEQAKANVEKSMADAEFMNQLNRALLAHTRPAGTA